MSFAKASAQSKPMLRAKRTFWFLCSKLFSSMSIYNTFKAISYLYDKAWPIVQKFLFKISHTGILTLKYLFIQKIIFVVSTEVSWWAITHRSWFHKIKRLADSPNMAEPIILVISFFLNYVDKIKQTVAKSLAMLFQKSLNSPKI